MGLCVCSHVYALFDLVSVCVRLCVYVCLILCGYVLVMVCVRALLPLLLIDIFSERSERTNGARY